MDSAATASNSAHAIADDPVATLRRTSFSPTVRADLEAGLISEKVAREMYGL
jgi:hypothetical protein